MFSSRPARRSFLNPGLSTSTMYLPIRNGVNTNVPELEVFVLCANEVPSLRIVTDAPGITAPVLSWTVPSIVPVSTWALRVHARQTKVTANKICLTSWEDNMAHVAPFDSAVSDSELYHQKREASMLSLLRFAQVSSLQSIGTTPSPGPFRPAVRMKPSRT